MYAPSCAIDAFFSGESACAIEHLSRKQFMCGHRRTTHEGTRYGIR
jgi:hypothetical protein